MNLKTINNHSIEIFPDIKHVLRERLRKLFQHILSGETYDSKSVYKVRF